MNIPKPFTRKRNQQLTKGSTTSDPESQKKNCVNLEELFQFEAARQRALAQVGPEEYQKPFSDFVPYRIFINYLDIFNGSHLAKYLSEVVREHEREGEGDYEERRKESSREGEGDYEERRKETRYQEAVEEEEKLVYEEEDLSGEGTSQKSSSSYEIVGTLEFTKNREYNRPDWITELLDQEKKADFLEKVLTCGYIIYDITSDLQCHPKLVEEAKWVLESIVKRLDGMKMNRPKAFMKYKHCRTFILISTLMTWARTKPIDPDNPSLPFTERDFRKRKPHPNYKIHCELEKRVIELGKKYPNNLRTIVIGSGIPYGHEEDVLHFLFKMAWMDVPHLPIFKPGTNILPVIHIDSLSSVIQTVIENFPRKYRYIIATDPHPVTSKEMTKLLAKLLGNGKTMMVNKEEAFLYPDIKQKNYDMVTCNINIVPGYIMDNAAIRWGSDAPFNKNIPRLITEFKKARGLLPIKVFIHGPPASGKTFMAKRLAKYYDIPHLHVKGVIEAAIQDLKDKIKLTEEKNVRNEEKAKEEKIQIEGDEVEDGEDEEEEEDEKSVNLEDLKETLREIEDNMDNERQRLSEEYVVRFFKEKLLSNSCKNKGYVIDGYPKTMELTKALYEYSPDEEDKEEEGEVEDNGQGPVSHLCNMKIMPAYVESFDASDEFLIERVIKLPDNIVSHYEEHDMCRRLTEFRAVNTEDNTPLIFYDELDVHPMIYNVEKDSDPEMEPTFQAIIRHIGPPKNYGKERKEMEELLAAEVATNNIKRVEELKAQREEIRKAAEERRENLEKWMLQKNQELEMEEKALLMIGMPLRHYLMKYIFPCLTRGLVEVARVRPDDPVDFLSEFLFRENPEGKMFQPNYEEKEEKLAQAIKEYESMLAARQGGGDGGSSKKSFSTEKSARSAVVSGVTDWKCSLVSSKSKSGYSHTTNRISDNSQLSGKSGKDQGKSQKSSGSMGSEGVCTCQKSPSLSTCSSDKTPSTATSCTCSTSSPCEPCEPCDTPEEIDPCKCPCLIGL